MIYCRIICLYLPQRINQVHENIIIHGSYGSWFHDKIHSVFLHDMPSWQEGVTPTAEFLLRNTNGGEAGKKNTKKA